jgi:hypothetical protein
MSKVESLPSLERLDTSVKGSLSSTSPIISSATSIVAPTNTTISRKVHQVLSISSSLGDNEQLRTALQYLGTFYGENTINERRNLRGVLERKTLETHKELLKEFSKVNDVGLSYSKYFNIAAIRAIGQSCGRSQQDMQLD